MCEVTGISERDIMSKSKSEEIVDARHLLVVTLRRSGYYPGMIAERLHIAEALGIDPFGEELQYLAGEIGRKTYPVARIYLCSRCGG